MIKTTVNTPRQVGAYISYTSNLLHNQFEVSRDLVKIPVNWLLELVEDVLMVSKKDLLSNEVAINLYVLSPLIKDEVWRKISSRLIITNKFRLPKSHVKNYLYWKLQLPSLLPLGRGGYTILKNKKNHPFLQTHRT